MERLSNLSWDAVQEGDELPRLTFGPVTVTHLVKDAAGTRDLYPIHHDREFARANGARDIFFNTMWYQGFIGRYVTTEWAGHEALLRRLAFSMRGPNCPGDVITARGRVLKKYQQDGRKLVDLDVRLDNQLGPDQVIASVTVEFAR
jgi:acyl dehydratase